jgi:hypothetical protein
MADTEARLRYRITADGMEVLDETGRKLGVIAQKAEDAGNRGTSGFSRLQARIVTLNQAVDLAKRAFEMLVAPVQRVIDESSAQEAALTRLNAQLVASGQYSEQYSRRLVDLAGKQQRLAAVGDETINNVQRQLIAFGAMPENIERVTQAALDLSAGMGTDVSSAAFLMGKAMAGEFGTLSRYGIFVDDGATKAQKFEQALRQVESRFGGQAAAQASTYEGSVRGVGLAFGDMLEEIGNVITQSDAMKIGLESVRDMFFSGAEATAKWVTENRAIIELNITEVFRGLAGTLPEATTALGTVATALHGVASAMMEVGRGFSYLNESREGFVMWWMDVAEWASEHQVKYRQGTGTPTGEAGPTTGIISPMGEAGPTTGETIATQVTAEQRSSAALTIAKSRLDLEQQRLEIAKQSNSSDAIMLAQARQVDLAQRNVLQATIAQLSAKRSVAAEENKSTVEIDAQISGLQQSLNLLTESGGAAKKLADEMQRTHDEAILKAEDIASKARLAIAETTLTVLRDSGASYQEQLVAARQLDVEQKRALDQQIDVLTTKKGVTESERIVMDAQVDALKQQRELIDGATGAAASLTREWEQQRKVTLDLGDTLEESVARWRDFGKAGFLEDVSNRVSDAFIGGLLKATLFKDKWDAQIGDNFTVTLPGFMQTGASAMESIFSGAMSGIEGSARSGVGNIGSMFSGLGDVVTGLGRNVPWLSSFLGGAASAGAAGTTSVTNPMWTSPWAAEGQSVSGVGEVAGGAAGAGAVGAGAAGASLAGPIGMAAAIAAPMVLPVISDLISSATHSESMTVRGAMWGSIVPVLGTMIGAAVGGILDLIGIGNGPTRGTLMATEAQKEWSKAGLPLQGVWSGGGEAGFREAGAGSWATAAERDLAEQRYGYRGDILGASRMPQVTAGKDWQDVSAMRSGAALGLAGVLFGEKAQGPSEVLGMSNRITNNFLAMGVSTKEAKRELRVFAEAEGITSFNVGLEALQKNFSEKGGLQKDIEYITDSTQGLADLFSEDWPAGMDVAGIAMRHFTETAGFDIAEVNDDLTTTLQIFQQIQSELSGGLGEAVGNLFNPDNTTSFADSLMNATHEAISSGMQQAFTAQVLELPEYAAWQKSIGTLVEDAVGGNLIKAMTVDLPEVQSTMTAMLTTLGPAMEVMAQVAEEANKMFLTSSYGYGELAKQARADMTTIGEANIAPVDKMPWLRAKISSEEAAYGSAATEFDRYTHLENIRTYGNELAQEASRRYVPGSYAGRQATWEAQQALDLVASEAESRADAQKQQTDATVKLSESTDTLVAVLADIKTVLEEPTAVEMDVTFAGQEAPAMTLTQFKALLLQVLDDAQVRVKTQQTAAGV